MNTSNSCMNYSVRQCLSHVSLWLTATPGFGNNQCTCIQVNALSFVHTNRMLGGCLRNLVWPRVIGVRF
ncbi:hypothetical protein FKM82_014358 [Ascaphus truei]